MDDPNLIRQAQRGDQVALARLLQQHYLPVKKYLVTITFDRNLAEDLTQETMIRAIERIGQFQGRAAFSTWLCSIATRQYLDWLRRQKRERRLTERAAEEVCTGGRSRRPRCRASWPHCRPCPGRLRSAWC